MKTRLMKDRAGTLCSVGGIVKLLRSIEQKILHPALYDDQKELLRARLMLIVCLSPLLVFAPFIVYANMLAPERPVTHLILAIGHLLVTLTPLSLRLFPTTEKPALAFTAMATLQVVVATSLTGGIYSPVLYTFPLLPVLAGFLARTKGVVTCCAVSIGSVWYLEMNAPEVKPFIAEGVESATLAWSILTAAIVATVSMKLNDRLNVRLLDELRQRTQAEEETQKARELKDSFLGYLSHEMRSPLSVIVGSLDLMEQTVEPKIQIRHSKAMRSASDGMVRLMDDLLDITALENGRLRLDVEAVNAEVLAEEICREFEVMAQEKGLSIKVQAGSDLKDMECDRQRLKQVVSNLISNALKYTVAGGVEIEVRSVDGCCRLSVSDSGVGIHPTVLEKIFDPFYRGASASIKGVGLGLPIAKQLLSRMNSEIHVESVVGEGTTFWFELPFSV
jgi:signal transduction histidine kinase